MIRNIIKGWRIQQLKMKRKGMKYRVSYRLAWRDVVKTKLDKKKPKTR